MSGMTFYQVLIVEISVVEISIWECVENQELKRYRNHLGRVSNCVGQVEKDLYLYYLLSQPPHPPWSFPPSPRPRPLCHPLSTSSSSPLLLLRLMEHGLVVSSTTASTASTTTSTTSTTTIISGWPCSNARMAEDRDLL